MKMDAERGEYTSMAKRWKLPQTLAGGTQAMRDAGELYLPKEPAESRAGHERRVNRAVLFNEFRRNIGTLAGYIFSRPIEYRAGEDEAPLSAEIEDLIADVDRDGTPMEELAQELFERGAISGLAHILVDMPAETGDGSLAATRELRVRPYFVLIRAENLIGWRTRVVNGQTILTAIRYKTWREAVNAETGAEEMIEQVRFREITGPEASLETVYEKAKDGDWAAVGEPAIMAMGKITLATFYASRTGFLTAKPPFEDLAWMNLRWWQSYADQANILHVARVPILFGKGMDAKEDGEQEIGAGAMVTGDAQSDLKWVEHSGRAVDAGRQDILDTEERMARMSVETYMARRAATATAAGIDAKQSMSLGQLMAVNLSQALTKAIEFAAEWLGQEFEGEAVVNTEFGLRNADQATVVALNAARDRGDLSRRDYLDQLSRIRVIEDLDHDGNDERLALEAGRSLENEPPADDEDEGEA